MTEKKIDSQENQAMGTEESTPRDPEEEIIDREKSSQIQEGQCDCACADAASMV